MLSAQIRQSRYTTDYYNLVYNIRIGRYAVDKMTHLNVYYKTM